MTDATAATLATQIILSCSATRGPARDGTRAPCRQCREEVEALFRLFRRLHTSGLATGPS